MDRSKIKFEIAAFCQPLTTWAVEVFLQVALRKYLPPSSTK